MFCIHKLVPKLEESFKATTTYIMKCQQLSTTVVSDNLQRLLINLKTINHRQSERDSIIFLRFFGEVSIVGSECEGAFRPVSFWGKCSKTTHNVGISGFSALVQD
jgi:hypothetical protein